MDYENLARQITKDCESQLGHKVTIEYWKSNRPYSGRAYCKTFTVKVPHPLSDISFNTFCHELGHLMTNDKLSCMREYKASMFALETMQQHGIRISRKVRQHHNWYIAYSLAQALNRNLKQVPKELKPFMKYLDKSQITFIYGDGRRKSAIRYQSILSKC